MTVYDPDILSTIAKYEPEFFAYIEHVREQNGSATIRAKARSDHKNVLWACLWYALERGVLVTVVPEILHHPLPEREPNGFPAGEHSEGSTLESAPKAEGDLKTEAALPVPLPDDGYVSNDGYMKKRPANT
jgi:hypothetical protein